MRKQVDKIIYSPSDLTRFMQSPFASWMERKKLEDPSVNQFKDELDPILQLLQKKGFEHEDKFSSQLKQNRHDLLEIKAASPEIAATETIKAMHDGREIIVQGYLSSDSFAGYADYLHKISGSSKLGDYHYEVWDTKLSKKLKPYFLIQLCCYAEMIKEIQGIRPEYFSIILGNNQQERLRVSDFFAYYQTLKNAFLEQQDAFDPKQTPSPADSHAYGEWSNYATKLLQDKDHLSQVANIRRSLIKNLNQANKTTMTELAETDLSSVPKVSQPAFDRLKAQAKLQKDSKEGQPPTFRILPHITNEAKGLALLPPSSSKDIFFDLEGDFLLDDGLEYLWGAAYFDTNGQRVFKDFWAHNQKEERQALIDFVTWAYARWQNDPAMHIYHYGSYEISALRRLMGRYGICENEIDNLLRGEVFVDLLAVIRNGVLVGEPSYSLKNIEKLYRQERKTEVATGSESVVVYEAWREAPDGDDWKSSEVLKNIRDYNIDDCYSTQELAEWLREQQAKNKITYVNPKTSEAQETPEEKNEITELRDQLLAKAEIIKSEPLAQVIETLGWCLEFHRRENKPIWWRYFDRRGMSELDLEDDMDCLIGLKRTATPAFKPSEKARTLAQEYSFNPDQPFKGKAKSFYVLGHDELKLTTHEYQPDEGIITFKHKNNLPDEMSVIPDEYINPKPITIAIYNIAKDCLARNFTSSAITDFLCRTSPRIKNHSEESVIKNKDNLLPEIVQAVSNLNNSYLCIQGPPGSGKTYTATHIIGELLQQGKRVGISSNSHKAINNLLEGVADHVNKNTIQAFLAKIGDGEDLSNDIKLYRSASQFSDFSSPNLCVGGTAWAFCNEAFANQFDYLFVDEAGQVSIANLIGMSQSTKNIILMGDQMQLAQPIQGTHPGESGKSILEYLLQDHVTIPENLGIFLPHTYRMHPDVCSFISEMIYAGRLQSKVSSKRHIDISGKFIKKQAGICFIPVEHEGNTQASEEEVDIIKSLADELLGCDFILGDDTKPSRSLSWKDILFVAPYNHQVNQLRGVLGNKAQIGSVDKFQGQEAPVVILSMCTSDATESPRGIDFIFSKNRLNVAISRAQCLAIIVGNPNLATALATNIRQMTQINMFAHLVQKEKIGRKIKDG